VQTAAVALPTQLQFAQAIPCRQRHPAVNAQSSRIRLQFHQLLKLRQSSAVMPAA
jgi:hypothetical protein